MHVTSVAVILALTCLSSSLALPAASKRDDVEIVPLEKNPFGTQPIIDTGFFGGWNDGPFSNPFGGFFESLESIMTRMRQQMDAVLKRFPLSRGNSSAEIPDFSLEGGLPPFPEFGDIDLGKGNSTSITKVIDGHKVVINETEYKKEGDFGGTYFKVKVIDVKPDSPESTTQSEIPTPQPTSTVKDKESVENSAENEIIKSKEVGNTNNAPEKLTAV